MDEQASTRFSKTAEVKSSAHSIFIASTQISVRAGFGASLAVVIAQWVHLPHPLYAMISAIIVTDLSTSETRKLGGPRIAGTALGAFLGAIFSSLLPPAAWSVGLGVFASMLFCYPMRLNHTAKLAGYTCGIVMLSYGEHPWSYSLYRLLEVSLGIVVAMAVSLVPKLLSNDAEKGERL